MGTPRASSTSAAPHSEVTARLPCLATLAPAAAATSAAPDEMLKVSGPPPPVPTTSTSSSRSTSVKGSGVARWRITWTKPASSGASSPRVASTVSSAAVSTSGTPPARISSSAPAACSRVSAAPSSASGFKSSLSVAISFHDSGGEMVKPRPGGYSDCAGPRVCRSFAAQDSICLPLAWFRGLGRSRVRFRIPNLSGSGRPQTT
jgi:hypothetical protein